MNTNSNAINITRRDYFNLPPEMRCVGDGPMVLTSICGRSTFVPAIIVG